MAAFISLKNVYKEYKVGTGVVQAASNVNFDIEEGEFVVILGSSGSGKSTTLNLIGGLDTASKGKIFVEGMEITKYSVKELTKYRRDNIGFVFQFYNLIPNLTAYENVDISRKLSNDSLKADELLDLVQLSSRKNHFPSSLSGGEMQRVSIARALCKNPKILLCDEPTGALDSATGKNILKLLKEMAEKYGKTVIMVTHNNNIAKVADKVIRMKDGTVVDVSVNSTPISPEEVEL